MIICYEGTPGSGKSYDAVRKILDNLKLGRTVYTNIDGLDGDTEREHIKCYTGLDDYQLSKNLVMLAKNEVYKFWEGTKNGSLIVIDEAHKWFNSRDWQKETNKDFANWCSTHRHYGYDVLLITQNIEKIDSAARGLVEWTYRYKKVNFLGSLVGNTYLCYAYQEDASGKPIKKITRQYNKAIFKCYHSYVSKDMTEIGIQKHTNILFHPIFYAIPIMMIVFLYLFSKSGFAKGQIIPGAASALKMTTEVSTVAVGASKPDGSIKSSVASGSIQGGAVAAPVSSGPTEASVGVEEGISVSSTDRLFVIESMIGFSGDDASGWVVYYPFGRKDVKIRASHLEFDRLCRCNSFGRYHGGDILNL